jgi:hypothetical protein
LGLRKPIFTSVGASGFIAVYLPPAAPALARVVGRDAVVLIGNTSQPAKTKLFQGLGQGIFIWCKLPSEREAE